MLVTPAIPPSKTEPLGLSLSSSVTPVTWVPHTLGFYKLRVPDESCQVPGLSRPSAVSSFIFCLHWALAHCRWTLGFTLWEFLKLSWRSNHSAYLKNTNGCKSLSLCRPISSAAQGCARRAGLAAGRVLQAYCHRTASQEPQDCSWSLLLEQNTWEHCHRHCKQCSAQSVWFLIDWEESSAWLGILRCP